MKVYNNNNDMMWNVFWENRLVELVGTVLLGHVVIG